MENNRPINTGPRKFPFFTVILLAFLVIVLVITFTSGNTDSKKEINRTDFLITIMLLFMVFIKARAIQKQNKS